MIFDTKQFVPKVYSDSRDYQALLKLLDILLTNTKYEIDELIDLYIPELCQSNLLPYLANLVGYTYNYKDSVTENRVIIKNFTNMIRNRGSITGIKLSAALSLSGIGDINQINDLAYMDVLFDYETGTISVYYPQEKTKVRNLLDWVRPVGMYLNLVPAIHSIETESMTISTDVKVNVVNYDAIRFSGVEWAEVDLGQVESTNFAAPSTWGDCLDYSWTELSEYNWGDFLNN